MGIALDGMCNIFVVGFPRSGTTVVQQYVAGAARLYTAPETHYFFDRYATPFDRFLPTSISDKIVVKRPKFWRNKNKVISDQISALKSTQDFLDFMGRQRGWVEKTPSHVRRVGVIKSIIPDSCFIHVVRDFPSVLASWQKIGDVGGFLYKPDRIFRNWRRDLERSMYWVRKCPNENYILDYNLFCNKPEYYLNLLDEKLGLDFGQEVVGASAVVLDGEFWKSNNFRPVGVGSSAIPQENFDGWEEFYLEALNMVIV